MENGRDDRGRFANGNPGGPGRPLGTSNTALREFREAVNGRLGEVIESVLQQACEGNLTAARLIFDRCYPVIGAALLDLAARLDTLETTDDDSQRDPEPDRET